MKLDEFAEIVWRRLEVSNKTLYNYEGGYRRYISPYVGLKEIGEITSSDLRDCLIRLPSQSRYQTHMMLRTIFREALVEGLIERSPMGSLKTPRVNPKPSKFLTWEELEKIDFGKFTNRIRFLALHGLRWSEAAAIEEDDIHDGFVWISKSVYGEVKSKTSIRKVPYLGYWEALPKSYKPMRLAANKHGVTVHSFRRTYAYLLKTQGIHVTTAQRLLGHADPIMTLKIYTSVLDNEVEDAGVLLRAKV